jgi:anti-sigma28 factor (negative regulator of flagellin synthesis)
MVSIHGLGGVPEPVPDKGSGVRDRRREPVDNKAPQDGVEISSQGRQASDVSRAVAIARQEPDVRPDKVEAAKDAIERGDHKKLQTIIEVAKRIERLLS